MTWTLRSSQLEINERSTRRKESVKLVEQVDEKMFSKNSKNGYGWGHFSSIYCNLHLLPADELTVFRLLDVAVFP